MLSGGTNSSNSTYYLYTNQAYWSGAPRNYTTYYSSKFGVYSTGNLDERSVSNACGVRPAVSLKPGVRFASGDGTSDTPYVVE